MSEEEQPDDGVDGDEFDEPFSGTAAGDREELAVDDLATKLERLEAELYDVRGELSRFERAVEDRTLKRPALEADLRRYVRRRMRRSRARGWGPYLVLLYGTIMTLGAFYFLAGVWAILAMVVVWLSTLGLYVVMVAFGAIVNLIGIPSRLRDAIAKRRS